MGEAAQSVGEGEKKGRGDKTQAYMYSSSSLVLVATGNCKETKDDTESGLQRDRGIPQGECGWRSRQCVGRGHVRGGERIGRER